MVRLADTQMIRPSDHRIIGSSDYQNIRPSDHPIIRSSDYRIIAASLTCNRQTPSNRPPTVPGQTSRIEQKLAKVAEAQAQIGDSSPRSLRASVPLAWNLRHLIGSSDYPPIRPSDHPSNVLHLPPFQLRDHLGHRFLQGPLGFETESLFDLGGTVPRGSDQLLQGIGIEHEAAANSIANRCGWSD